MKELAEQQNLKRKKVMSHYGVLALYEDLIKQADKRMYECVIDDPIAMTMLAQAEGMEDFADAIINTTPGDWN